MGWRKVPPPRSRKRSKSWGRKRATFTTLQFGLNRLYCSGGETMKDQHVSESILAKADSNNTF